VKMAKVTSSFYFLLVLLVVYGKDYDVLRGAQVRLTHNGLKYGKAAVF